MRRVENRLLRPLVRAAVSLTHSLLARQVRTVVGEQQIVIAATTQERLDNVPEQATILGAEEPVTDLVERPTQLSVLMVVIPGIVMRRECVHLGSSEAEDKNVVVADLLADLDVGAVHRTDGEGTVERELHVACAGGLGRGGGALP